MITLQIERLNLKAPYNVWRDEDGDLFFETDEGLLYSVELDENYETLQYKTCVFGIRNKDKTLSHGDPKLKATVLAIIEEFFLSNHGVLLYICSTKDKKQELRFRLFLRWFNTYEHRDLYVIRTIEKAMDDNVPNYGAIIVEKDHPEFDLIMQKFDEIAAFFMK